SLSTYAPVPGGLYYHAGDLVTDTIKDYLGYIKGDYFTKLFPTANTVKEGDMYCTQEGVFPFLGQFGYCDNDNPLKANGKATAWCFYYTEDNLYYALNAGTFGDVVPTHIEGVELNGDVKLLRISPIAKYEIR
ncbi:hypothetical protein, partial [Gemella morbillorum]